MLLITLTGGRGPVSGDYLLLKAFTRPTRFSAQLSQMKKHFSKC